MDGRGRNWRLAGIVVFAVAAVLLLSMGGAIVVAPITVPLLFFVSRRHRTAAFRIAGTVLAGLTVAEVVWALAYLQLEESKPWIWLLPTLAGGIAAISFTAGTNPRRVGSLPEPGPSASAPGRCWCPKTRLIHRGVSQPQEL